MPKETIDRKAAARVIDKLKAVDLSKKIYSFESAYDPEKEVLGLSMSGRGGPSGFAAGRPDVGKVPLGDPRPRRRRAPVNNQVCGGRLGWRRILRD